MSPRKTLAESASTGDMQVSVMPSDNNNFAVSSHMAFILLT